MDVGVPQKRQLAQYYVTTALVWPDAHRGWGCRTPDPGDDLDDPGIGLKRQSRVPEPGRTNCFSSG
jgi:hypothetical protein